jgi:hypothetical protein
MSIPSLSVELNDPQLDEGITKDELRKRQRATIIIGILAILLLAIIITSLILLLHPNTPETYVARIRDVFIIIMAFESLLIGAVLVILIIQLARLTNLLQNEIKPILDSTNETVSTLRGTTVFLSNNLSEPLIKLNEYFAGFMKLLDILGIGQRKP